MTAAPPGTPHYGLNAALALAQESSETAWDTPLRSLRSPVWQLAQLATSSE